MSLAVLTGIIVAVLIAAGGVLRRVRSGREGGSGAAVVLWLAVALTAGIAIAVFPAAWDDGGGFAFVLVGIPVACAALALVAHFGGTARTLLMGAAAAAMLLWSLVTALGLGLFFLAPALLLVAVAAVTRGARPTPSATR